MKKRKSIHDLSRELQVSASTVSFILNGKSEERRISKDLEKRVLDYIKETGFQPNMVAQSLRTGKSKIIGMLVEDISDTFFSCIARVIEINAYKKGYKIFFSSTENDTDKARALIRIYRDRQVDGYIIAPTPGIETDIQKLLDDGIPVVLFDRFFPDLPTHNIIVNNFGGAFDAIEHFYKNGYRNIGFVTLESTQSQMSDRLRGYKSAIETYKLPAFLLQTSYSLDEDVSKVHIKEFLSNHHQLDAILFATNYLTVAGLKALRELNLQVPANIGVASFDDNTLFALLSPSITAIAQPVHAISEQIMDKLMAMIEGGKKKPKMDIDTLPVQLNVRESSMKK